MIPRWTQPLVVGLALQAATVPARAIEPPPLLWRLDEGVAQRTESCAPSQEVALACGTYGTFHFATEPVPDCDTRPRVAEVPAPFVPEQRSEPPPDRWFPCRGGSCFVERATGPWAAVLDWDDAHGRSVASTLLEASDNTVEVELFPIDHPPAELAPVLERFATGDAHLLVQLCALAERVAEDPMAPPLVANISAGRHFTGSLPFQSTGSLSAQIAAVTEHLSVHDGIAFVAAAGNHRQEQFPAVLEGVLGVGALDLGKLRSGALPRPSWITDRSVQALFPALGLSLIEPGPGGGCWPAPPGSSYASALAAGWIAAYRQRGGTWIATDAALSWSPVAPGARYFLGRQGTPLPGTDLDGPNRLLRRALDGPACPEEQLVGDASLVRLGPALSNPLAWRMSLPRAEEVLGPSPSNDACVPCEILPRSRTGPAQLQLEDSGPFAAGVEVLEVYLVVDGVFQAIVADDGESFLSQTASGSLGTLRIEGFDEAVLHDDDEALLVYVLRRDGEEMWTSVPINRLQRTAAVD